MTRLRKTLDFDAPANFCFSLNAEVPDDLLQCLHSTRKPTITTLVSRVRRDRGRLGWTQASHRGLADGGIDGHLTIKQAAFAMLVTFRETLPISILWTWPRPRFPMTIRSICLLSA